MDGHLSMNIQSIILAAGQGTRIKDLTQGKPKQLLPIGRETLVGRLVRQLSENGVMHHHVAYHVHTDELRNHMFNLPSSMGQYSMLRSLPSKGENFSAMVNEISDPTVSSITLMGDNVFEDFAMKSFFQHVHNMKPAAELLFGIAPGTTAPSGKNYDPVKRIITRVEGRPDNPYAGMMWVSDKALERIRQLSLTHTYGSISDYINRLLNDGRTAATCNICGCYDINSKENYEACLRTLQS